MIDAKTAMRTDLYADPAMVTALGGKHVYKSTTANRKQIPRIVLFDVSESDTDFADNAPLAQDPIIQASIFSREETHTLFAQMDKTLKAAGWRRTFCREEYEEDEQLYHRIARYRKKFLYE